MCLDAHAHGMRMDHPIFHTPNKVALTLEERPTPSSYASYPEGKDLGPTMSMWRVQTEGYLDGKGQLIGVVSRNSGFFDSPDVEWISGGVNSKGPMAVAIGRHGNFLHWGFAVSPKYLTDEAKLVFVNAVHHIARFDGQTPVARKVPGTMIRADLGQMIHGLSDEGYAETEARYERIRAEQAERKRKIQARIDGGGEVSELSRQIASSDREITTPGRLDRVRRSLGEDVVAALDDDPERVAAYLRDNMSYLHPIGDWYELGVDEELRRFGVANDDVALLERAVAGLSDETRAELCRVLLVRYTNQDHTTPAEWTRWFEDVREDLFFSESAGYKWLVNRRANAASRQAAAPPTPTPTAAEPLVASASAHDLGNGRFEVRVRFAVLDGWHTYRDVPANAPYIPLTLELQLPGGVKAQGEWTKPSARNDPHTEGVTVLDGDFTFTRVFAADAKPSKPIECTLRYQVCDERMCLPPAQETLEVELR
ncbi:MAG: hypothetical protein GY711_16895 [bacterium]|nr:hypothetical protein [bacterium]